MNEVDILGIDLGTTNSAIVIWEPDTGDSRVLCNQDGDRITPSVVMFDPEIGEPIVGKSALDRTLGLETTLTRTQLETLVQPLIDRTLTICDTTLETAKMKPSDIDQVLLVGGQTRLPAVKVALRDRYDWTINDSVNRF